MSADVTVTPLLQAAYVCRMYALTMRLGVRETDIMYISDADKYNAALEETARQVKEIAANVVPGQRVGFGWIGHVGSPGSEVNR